MGREQKKKVWIQVFPVFAKLTSYQFISLYCIRISQKKAGKAKSKSL
jgi:hypothetical protein